MSVRSLFISGPRLTGKSTLAALLAEQMLNQKVHYLRMVPAADAYTNAVFPFPQGTEMEMPTLSWASVHRVIYTPDRLFEIVPEGLRAVRKLDSSGLAMIEANADPALRYAYPYDFRVFVMAAPSHIHTIFRTPEAAALALHQVLQDTAAFATEIFGLFEDDELDDALGVDHCVMALESGSGQRVEQLSIAEMQIEHFLSSPLGTEIASRVQLQPDYHALVEADVVIINTGTQTHPDRREVLDECVARLQKLLSRVRQDARKQSVLYWGDLHQNNGARAKLIQRIHKLVTTED